MNIPSTVQCILDRLADAGQEAYMVGGSVRDIIFGREPKDYDICSSATPQQVREIFEHVVPTGEKYGTMTVLLDGIGYEITTMRRDGTYEDGRRPENVEYTTDIKEDLSRRDLTINAMAINRYGEIIDPFHGELDIGSMTIRAVGDPKQRFQEDALRMMRAIRFAAQLGFQIDGRTYGAIAASHELIENVSMERIRDELCKILLSTSVRASRGIRHLYDTNLLDRFLPELSACYGFEQFNPHHDKNVFNHTMEVLENTPTDLVIRLSALFHDIAKPLTRTFGDDGIGHFYEHDLIGAEKTENIMRRLKFDNNTIERVTKIIREHMCKPHKTASIKRLMNRIGVENMEALICLQRADILGSKPPFDLSYIKRINEESRMILEDKHPITTKELAINGHDLKSIGIEPGPRMGKIIVRLHDLVLEDPSLNTKEVLLGKVKEDEKWRNIVKSQL